MRRPASRALRRQRPGSRSPAFRLGKGKVVWVIDGGRAVHVSCMRCTPRSRAASHAHEGGKSDVVWCDGATSRVPSSRAPHRPLDAACRTSRSPTSLWPISCYSAKVKGEASEEEEDCSAAQPPPACSAGLDGGRVDAPARSRSLPLRGTDGMAPATTVSRESPGRVDRRDAGARGAQAAAVFDKLSLSASAPRRAAAGSGSYLDSLHARSIGARNALVIPAAPVSHGSASSSRASSSGGGGAGGGGSTSGGGRAFLHAAQRPVSGCASSSADALRYLKHRQLERQGSRGSAGLTLDVDALVSTSSAAADAPADAPGRSLSLTLAVPPAAVVTSPSAACARPGDGASRRRELAAPVLQLKTRRGASTPEPCASNERPEGVRGAYATASSRTAVEALRQSPVLIGGRTLKAVRTRAVGSSAVGAGVGLTGGTTETLESVKRPEGGAAASPATSPGSLERLDRQSSFRIGTVMAEHVEAHPEEDILPPVYR